jgi:dephospho-CoA kinase
MVVVGLIGRIGAGKSTVARMFAARGASVIDADALAHEVLDDEAARAEVVRRFGADALEPDGRVSRRALAAKVFDAASGPAALRDLEAIIHPRVRSRIEAELARLRRVHAAADPPHVVVLDVPLLVQAGWDAACDRLVMVTCDDGVRQARLAGRGWDPAQQAAREQAWDRGFRAEAVPPEKTVSVDASGDPSYTEDQIERIWRGLLRH